MICTHVKIRESCSRKKTEPEARIKFWFYLEVNPRRVRIKGKESKTTEAAKQWDTVLTVTSKFVWKGHTGHSAGAFTLHVEFLLLHAACKERVTPGSLLTPAFYWLRFTSLRNAMSALWVILSEAESEEVAADREGQKNKAIKDFWGHIEFGSEDNVYIKFHHSIQLSE